MCWRAGDWRGDALAMQVHAGGFGTYRLCRGWAICVAVGAQEGGGDAGGWARGQTRSGTATWRGGRAWDGESRCSGQVTWRGGELGRWAGEPLRCIEARAWVLGEVSSSSDSRWLWRMLGGRRRQELGEGVGVLSSAVASAVQLVGTLGLPKGSAAELGHVYGGESWRVRGCEMGGRLAAGRTGAASRGCRAGRAGQRAHKLQSSFQLWALEGATSAVWCRLALAVML